MSAHLHAAWGIAYRDKNTWGLVQNNDRSAKTFGSKQAAAAYIKREMEIAARTDGYDDWIPVRLVPAHDPRHQVGDVWEHPQGKTYPGEWGPMRVKQVRMEDRLTLLIMQDSKTRVEIPGGEWALDELRDAGWRKRQRGRR